MKVRLRDEALSDLVRIHNWIAQENTAAAGRVVERVFVEIERLGTFPRIGRRGSKPDTHEWVVTGLPYIVVYRIDEAEDLLSVIAIVHAARDR